MNCVILQPSYIPWRGYFHQIEKADFFVFYDDVQYDKRGWRNRNRIKTNEGTIWLTIPVHAGGAQLQQTPINSVRIVQKDRWNHKHLKTLKQQYSKAPYFGRYYQLIEEFYRSSPVLLADFTIDSTMALVKELGIEDTIFIRSSQLNAGGDKTDRVVNILTELGADHYISGPSAKEYLEEEKLHEAGISVEYMVYDYPEYRQLYPPYDPNVSVLDLLFMKGPNAPEYIW